MPELRGLPSVTLMCSGASGNGGQGEFVRKFLSLLVVCTLSAAVAACMGSGEASRPAANAPRVDPVLAGVVAGPMGTALTQEDRLIAGKAQYQAIVDG